MGACEKNLTFIKNVKTNRFAVLFMEIVEDIDGTVRSVLSVQVFQNCPGS